MRAILLEAHDGPMRVAEAPQPVPRAGEVLVRVRASAVNPLDLKIRAGQAAHARHPLPAILGIDLAGVVEAVGQGVEGFAPGLRVFGMTGGVGGAPGSLAQFAAVDARLLAPMPSTLDFRQAAALPLAFITAWEGLVDRARVEAGHRVLVIGAGGVGNVVIQIARALGAEVFAVDGATKAEAIRGWGAVAIDRTQPVEDYVAEHTGGAGFDIAYDTVGGVGLDHAFQAVRRFGHAVSCLGWGAHALAPLSFKGGSYSGVFTLMPLLTGQGRERHGEIMRQAAMLADSGRLVPSLDPRRFSLAQTEAAYQAMADRTATGKVVIEVD